MEMEHTVLYAVLFILLWICAVDGETCRPNAPRRDCGYFGINQQQCESKGCCWVPTEGQPWCFFKTSAPASYQVDSVTSNDLGMKLSLKAAGSTSTQFGDLITPLAVDITMESKERLYVKIYDPNNKRWEIPSDISPTGDIPSTAPIGRLYKYDVAKEGEMFYFAISRLGSGEVLFNTSYADEPLEFVDQYLAISTILPGTESLYGLGEHKVSLQLKKGQTFTLWNFDTPTPTNLNLYGSHPFYIDLRQSGMAHGVIVMEWMSSMVISI